MKRSSSDNPPRVGMVVRLTRDTSGEPLKVLPFARAVTWLDSTGYAGWSQGCTVVRAYWNRGQYDIISEPAEAKECPVACCIFDRGHAGDCNDGNGEFPRMKPPPCNCPQSLALIHALRRIVAAMDDCNVNAAGTRDPVDVLTEVNLIARKALK